jgi:hypothetical protein
MTPTGYYNVGCWSCSADNGAGCAAATCWPSPSRYCHRHEPFCAEIRSRHARPSVETHPDAPGSSMKRTYVSNLTPALFSPRARTARRLAHRRCAAQPPGAPRPPRLRSRQRRARAPSDLQTLHQVSRAGEEHAIAVLDKCETEGCAEMRPRQKALLEWPHKAGRTDVRLLGQTVEAVS